MSPIHLLSRRCRRVNAAACSGLQATPDSFRPGQRPLVSSPGPCSCSGSSRFSNRSLSPSRDPEFGSRPPTLLAGVDRRRPLVCTLPLTDFGSISASWSQAQVPARVSGSSRSSNRLLSPSRGPESVFRPTTLLSVRCGLVSSARVLWSARYPCWISAPSAPPGHQPRHPSIDSEFGRVSSSAFLDSPRSAFTLRFSALLRACDGFVRRHPPRALVCALPLLALAPAAPPDRLPTRQEPRLASAPEIFQESLVWRVGPGYEVSES